VWQIFTLEEEYYMVSTKSKMVGEKEVESGPSSANIIVILEA